MTMKDDDSFDPDALLRGVHEVQAGFVESLTPEERAILPQVPSTRDGAAAPYAFSAEDEQGALEDFALNGAAESMKLFADQIDAVIEYKLAKAYKIALDVYYAAEGLAEDPAQTEARAFVEQMRAAYMAQYGKPIPPKE